MTSDENDKAGQDLSPSIRDDLLDIRAIALGAKLLITNNPEDRDTGLDVARLLDKIVAHVEAVIGPDRTRSLHD